MLKEIYPTNSRNFYNKDYTKISFHNAQAFVKSFQKKTNILHHPLRPNHGLFRFATRLSFLV